MVIGGTHSRPAPRAPDRTSMAGIQIGLALAVLGLGALVYVVDRPPGLTALPMSISLFDGASKLFGPLGQSLPGFAHVYAFSLLTALLAGNDRRTAIRCCGSWLAVNWIFEIGQLPSVVDSLASLSPAWFDAIPFLARVANYFSHGTFDPADLISVAAGALAAYLTLRRMQSERK